MPLSLDRSKNYNKVLLRSRLDDVNHLISDLIDVKDMESYKEIMLHITCGNNVLISKLDKDIKDNNVE